MNSLNKKTVINYNQSPKNSITSQSSNTQKSSRVWDKKDSIKIVLNQINQKQVKKYDMKKDQETINYAQQSPTIRISLVNESEKQPQIKIQPLKDSLYQKKISQLPQIKITPVVQKPQQQKQSDSLKQIKLIQDLIKAKQLQRASQKKYNQLLIEYEEIQQEVKEQKQKNKQLNERVINLLQHNQNVQNLIQLEKQNSQLLSQFQLQSAQNNQLKIVNQRLLRKEKILDRLQVQYHTLKLKCQDYEGNTEKYKNEIMTMKKKIRQFQQQFYSQGKKKLNKNQQRQFFMSMTEKKLQLVEAKVHNFQDSYFLHQLQTFQRQKGNLIVKYAKILENDIQKVNRTSDFTDITKRQFWLQQLRSQNVHQLNYQLQPVQKKIQEIKRRIEQKNAIRQKLNIRQRIEQIQQKISRFSHTQIKQSQIHYRQADEIASSKDVLDLRNKVSMQGNQIQHLKKMATNSYISQTDKQKYTIKVISQSGDSNSSPKNSMKMSLRNMNVSNIRNTYLSTLIGNKLQTRQQYQDGTLVPTLAQYKQMKQDLLNLKRRVQAMDEQIIHLRTSYEKNHQDNNRLYQQKQELKKKYRQLQKKTYSFQLNNQADSKQMQRVSQMNYQYLKKQLQLSSHENEKQRSLISKHQRQILDLKKLKQKHLEEIQRLKNELTFLQAKYQAKLSQKNAKFAQKISGKLQYHAKLQRAIEQRDAKLQQFLEQNLDFMKKQQQKQLKISQLEDLIKQQTNKVQQNQKLIEQLNSQLYNMAYKLSQNEQNIHKKDIQIKKLQQNLSQQMQQKRAEIAGIKKQKKKIQLKMQALKQKYDKDMKNKDKKYKKLQDKYIGVYEKYDNILRKSSQLSNSNSISKSSFVIQHQQFQQINQSSLIMKSFKQDTILKKSKSDRILFY